MSLISADFAKAVTDALEMEHEQNEQQQQGRLEKRGQRNIVRPNNLIFDYPRDDDDDDSFDTGEPASFTKIYEY